MVDLSVGLVVAGLSMVGTLLALGVIAALTWALGRFVVDPPTPEPAQPKPASGQ